VVTRTDLVPPACWIATTDGRDEPAEFFAVATEAFFRTSRVLRAQASRLYAEFALFLPGRIPSLFGRPTTLLDHE